MPRRARSLANSNTYHVMLRGINRQRIFHDEEDYLRFLEILKKCKDLCGFDLYAYCLMPNHIHLLIRPDHEPLELIFKRIGCRYVYWYNQKYERVGHLFQDRYKSENVEDERYFLTCLRYIIQNPLKAGLEKEIGTYPWNCFDAYRYGKYDSLIDPAPATDMIGSEKALSEFICETNEDVVTDISDENQKITDKQAAVIMKDLTNCSSAAEFQQFPKEIQKQMIRSLYAQNLSLSQIASLTGKTKSAIYRAK